MKAKPTFFTNRVVGWDFFSCEHYYRIGFGADFCKCYPSYSNDYDLLSPILPNSLRTIPQLTCQSPLNMRLHWTLPWHHLMHLPTIDYIKISFIRNFPLSGLTSSDNLHWLNISHLFDAGRENGSLEIVQPEKMFRELRCCMLNGVCEELEMMAGRNMPEALTFEVKVIGDETEDFIASVFQKEEEILVKPGWSALRQVYFKVSCSNGTPMSRSQLEALECLPDKYLSHFPNTRVRCFQLFSSGHLSSKCKVRRLTPSQLFWASLLTMFGISFVSVL